MHQTSPATDDKTNLYSLKKIFHTSEYKQNKKKTLTVSLLIENKFPINVEKPGALQLCAIKPSFNSLMQTISSPRLRFH